MNELLDDVAVALRHGLPAVAGSIVALAVAYEKGDKKLSAVVIGIHILVAMYVGSIAYDFMPTDLENKGSYTALIGASSMKIFELLQELALKAAKKWAI